MSFELNSVRIIFFLGACFCWESRLPGEMDRRIKFGGTIGYGDSKLEFVIRHFEVIILHALLLDAAGAVTARTKKGVGNCYMIGPESK